jgi:uncharacterized integral membrane protein (TIGR00698 family)
LRSIDSHALLSHAQSREKQGLLVNLAEKIPDKEKPPSSGAPAPAKPAPWRVALSYIPGLSFCAAIAATAFSIRFLPGTAAISPMVVAFGVGIAVSALSGSLPVMAPGNRFAAKTMLRFAVGLLGLQLTIHELAELGAVTLLVVLAVFIATFLFTKWLGRMLGVEHSLTELIAAGTSVCGASAIIATNAVTKARDQDVGYAVAAVSLLGSVAMIVYPLLYGVLHLDLRTYSLWAGSSVHEVAQVVAAAFQVDPAAGQIAVPVKLARVALLAPLVLTLGWLRFRREGDAARASFRWRQIFPLFMVGFIALVALNSAVAIPAHWRGVVAQVTTFLLTMSLGAIGLETSVRDLRHQGIRPMLLTAVAALFIATLSLVLMTLIG